MGIVMLIVTGLGTLASYVLLLQSAKLTQCNSYETISHNLFGRYFSVGVKILIIISSVASLTAYMSVIAGSMTKFIRQFLEANATTPFVDPKVILAFALIIIIPMSLAKRITFLTWSSYVAILPLFYLLVLEVVFFAQKTNAGELKGTEVPIAKGGIFVALPIFVFAYSSQLGAIPIFKVRPNRSNHHFLLISLIFTHSYRSLKRSTTRRSLTCSRLRLCPSWQRFFCTQSLEYLVFLLTLQLSIQT